MFCSYLHLQCYPKNINKVNIPISNNWLRPIIKFYNLIKVQFGYPKCIARYGAGQEMSHFGKFVNYHVYEMYEVRQRQSSCSHPTYHRQSVIDKGVYKLTFCFCCFANWQFLHWAKIWATSLFRGKFFGKSLLYEPLKALQYNTHPSTIFNCSSLPNHFPSHFLFLLLLPFPLHYSDERLIDDVISSNSLKRQNSIAKLYPYLHLPAFFMCFKQLQLNYFLSFCNSIMPNVAFFFLLILFNLKMDLAKL